MPTQEWLDKTVAKLEISRQEAIEMWCDDHDIDAGMIKDFDLSPEKAKAAKEVAKAGRGKNAPANYSMENAAKKRAPRKEDAIKRRILKWLEGLFAGLMTSGEVQNVTVENPERQVDFFIDGEHYTLTLTKHRKPKA